MTIAARVGVLAASFVVSALFTSPMLAVYCAPKDGEVVLFAMSMPWSVLIPAVLLYFASDHGSSPGAEHHDAVYRWLWNVMPCHEGRDFDELSTIFWSLVALGIWINMFIVSALLIRQMTKPIYVPNAKAGTDVRQTR